MKVLVSADMEGVTGVTWPQDCDPGTEAWGRMRHLFTADVNAAIQGLFAGGASEVLVNEAHATMRNLVLEDLDPRATMITGRHKLLGMMQGVEGAHAVAYVGYHTAAGTEGVLAHTYMGQTLTGVWIDGVLASEGRLNTLLAAEHGVPVILVTGDDLTCLDAADYAPGAQGAAVKRAVSRYAAECLPPSRTAVLIREAAQRGAAAFVDGTVPRPDPTRAPHRFEIEFDTSHVALNVSMIPTVERTGVRRVAFAAPSMTEGMLAFRAVTHVASVAVEEIYG